MSKEIETAKALLKKAIRLKDQELINLANELLGEHEETTVEIEPQPKKRPGRKKKEPAIVQNNEPAKVINKKAQVGSKTTVQWTGNTWVDTGELGELGAEAKKTPKIKPAQRRPPAQKINIKCSMCGKDNLINPIYKTEFYKCDDCLRKLTGGSK